MSQPRYALGDPEDYEELKVYEWFVSTKGTCFYATRKYPTGKAGKYFLKTMHREIIDPGKGMLIDHINRNGMDNRRANIRPATYSQNSYNRNKHSRPSTSKYKGVSRRKQKKKWNARITVEGKQKWLGSFEDEIEAAKAYDRAAKKYHGEFASLNFPGNG